MNGQFFDWMDYEGLKISMIGDYQVKNAVVAVKTAEILIGKGFGNITETSIYKGLEKAIWPGRFEVVNKNPVFLIDGAHNQEGALALANNLMKYFPHKRKIIITGVLRDKDYASILNPIIPVADAFIAVTPNSDRALPAQELGMFLRTYCKDVTVSDTIRWAVENSLLKASIDDIICAYGSLYYIGEVRSIFGL
jgi:dihydrofolate synthase/folylpolyglutamate synthase